MSQISKKERKKKPSVEQEPDLDGIAYFTRPNLTKGLLVDKHVSNVFAGSNYCYALVK